MFVPVPSPSTEELKGLVQRIAERIGRSLERSGLITRDIDNAYLAFNPAEEAPIHGLLGSSITYRIATGARRCSPCLNDEGTGRLRTTAASICRRRPGFSSLQRFRSSHNGPLYALSATSSATKEASWNEQTTVSRK